MVPPFVVGRLKKAVTTKHTKGAKKGEASAQLLPYPFVSFVLFVVKKNWKSSHHERR